MKSIYKIRLSIIVLAGLLISGTTSAQVTQTDYFMKSSYLRTSLNPAMRPNQGYIVIPMLPNIGASVKTNTLNLDHLTTPLANGQRATFMHKDVDANTFLADIADNNYAMADVNYRIAGVGFYKGDKFWSVDLGLRVHADLNIPKSVFELVKVGFDQNAQSTYDLKNINATANAFVEVGVNHSRPFLDNSLIIGARVKALIGAADFDLNAKSMTIEAGPNQWRANSQITLQGSGPGLISKFKTNDDGKEEFDGFEFDNFALPGFGAGLDLGAEYDMAKALPALKGLKVSAAINDLGFITWNKKNSVSLISNPSGEDIIIDPSDYTIQTDGTSSLSDLFENVTDDLRKAADLEAEVSKARTTSLRSTLVVGAEYEIVPAKLTAGAMYSNRFGKYFNSSEITISANYAPIHWFAVSGGYSIIHSAFNTCGLALHLAPSKGVRFFLASDYIIPHTNSDFYPSTSKALNVQMGFSIPIGAKR